MKKFGALTAVVALAASFISAPVSNSLAQSCVLPTAGLVSWWPGDGNANDIVGSNNGILNGGMGFATGQVNQAFKFDGIDDFVNFGTTSSLKVESGPFTIDMWINLNNSNTDQMLMSSSQSDRFGYFVLINRGSFTPDAPNNIDLAKSGQIDQTAAQTFVPGVWYHIAVVQNFSGGSPSFVEFFVDGTSIGTFSHPTNYISSAGKDTRLGFNYIGPTFDGLIDEVKIFNRVLSAAEIESIFDAGSAGECKVIANAGPGQTVDELDMVTLDGSGSTGDGDPLTSYQWSQIAGPSVVNFDDTTDPIHPTFDAPIVAVGGATVTFELIVGDGTDFSDADTVDITITNVNNIPIADAGDFASSPEGSNVLLDGSNSFDLDNEQLTCTWEQTVGSVVAILDLNACVTSFTAPALVPLLGETLTFRLVVNDGLANSLPDTVNKLITHINQPPTADAGGPGPLSRDEGTIVSLDGTGSSDPDLDPLTFLWEQISGPPVTINNDTTNFATFDAPPVASGGEIFEFRLTVDDGELADDDTVIIAVQNINDPPNCDVAVASHERLWPPNHKLHLIEIANLADPDNDTIEIMVTSVFQDEPVNGLGDGDTSPDALIQMDDSIIDKVLLRAERAGRGNGRVYHINFSAFDGFEGCTGSIQVNVAPSRKGAPAVDDGPLFDSTLP